MKELTVIFGAGRLGRALVLAEDMLASKHHQPDLLLVTDSQASADQVKKDFSLSQAQASDYHQLRKVSAFAVENLTASPDTYDSVSIHLTACVNLANFPPNSNRRMIDQFNALSILQPLINYVSHLNANSISLYVHTRPTDVIATFLAERFLNNPLVSVHSCGMSTNVAQHKQNFYDVIPSGFIEKPFYLYDKSLTKFKSNGSGNSFTPAINYRQELHYTAARFSTVQGASWLGHYSATHKACVVGAELLDNLSRKEIDIFLDHVIQVRNDALDIENILREAEANRQAAD